MSEVKAIADRQMKIMEQEADRKLEAEKKEADIRLAREKMEIELSIQAAEEERRRMISEASRRALKKSVILNPENPADFDDICELYVEVCSEDFYNATLVSEVTNLMAQAKRFMHSRKPSDAAEVKRDNVESIFSQFADNLSKKN
jgi:hypothetical protein